MASMIISHMNNDHKISLFDYLEYYGEVALNPLDSSNDVEMQSIELDHMILKYSSKKQSNMTKKISINPPMKSLSEARKKLVDMANTAANAKGVAVRQIKDFIFPQGNKRWITFLLLVVPSSLYFAAITGILKRYWPSLLNNAIGRQPTKWMLLFLGIHLLEAFIFLRPRLNKYRVPYSTRAKWYLADLLEGFPSIQRFDKLTENQ